ncbi:helix-turn-helix domain-containing protein [Rhodococcus sp. NPDC003994]
MEHNIVVEFDSLAADLDNDTTDELMEPILPYSGIIGRSLLGRVELVFTLDAADVRAATQLGLALVADLYPTQRVVSVHVLPSEDYDRTAAIQPGGSLLSVTEAAAKLGVSRQRVLARITARTLPAFRIGEKAWAIPSSALSHRD